MSKTSSSNFGSNFQMYREKKNGYGSVASQTASSPSRFDDATNRKVRYAAQDRFFSQEAGVYWTSTGEPKHSGLHTIKNHAMFALVNGPKNANSMNRKIHFFQTSEKLRKYVVQLCHCITNYIHYNSEY